jgi:protein-S-isoprenylcysteine O-methyltransferase Ste14
MRKCWIISWTVARVAAAILLLGWGALHLRPFDSYLCVSVPTWSRIPAVILIICGGLLVLACGAILSTRGILTSRDRFFPKEFVAIGPFRYLRNPMSLGVVLLMLGLGLYESSASMVLFALALFLLLHLLVVYMEEPGLEKRFGESYREYKRSVRRWLPAFRRRKS